MLGKYRYINKKSREMGGGRLFTYFFYIYCKEGVVFGNFYGLCEKSFCDHRI